MGLFSAWKEYGRSVLPPHLRDKPHDDYVWPLSLIPRWATSYDWGVPKMLAGNQKYTRKDRWDEPGKEGPGPIGEKGSWQISYYPDAPLWAKLTGMAFYFAFTTKGGIHGRIGGRWDDIDGYTTAPAPALRRPSDATFDSINKQLGERGKNP